MATKLAILSSFLAAVKAQQIGTLQAENHPSLTWQTCTAPGSCTTNNGKVVLDSNWRWLHSTSGSTNCYTGNTWNTTLCPDDATCAQNCALDGADYTGTYGVTATGSSLKLNFVTNSAQKNIGSRLYLLADDTHYELFHLLNQEFTFDVDVSNLPCGLNGALYMVPMAADGGVSQYPNNKAGAQYGVGYCDSQCPRDLKFINGEANSDGWQPASNSVNTGLGNYGSCCAEMDIWEANSISAALTPHSADTVTQTRCTGNDCGGTYSDDRYSGTTDPDGCDFNSYRQGDTSFYGPGKTVDTTKPFTVVTQFLTDDSGNMNEIKRFYVQNNVVIPNSQSTVAGIPGNSITEDYCVAQKTVFGDTNDYDAHGGFASMTAAMKAGMVLVLSLWDDYYADMLWLDSVAYPTDGDPSQPGIARGTCATTSGSPPDVESNSPNAYVTYSNIKIGPINSTFSGTPGNPGGPSSSSSSTRSTTLHTTTSTRTTTTRGTTTTTSSGATQTHWGQCGGQGWTGPTACEGQFTSKWLSWFKGRQLKLELAIRSATPSSSSSVYAVVNGSAIDSIYADKVAATARCAEANEDDEDGEDAFQVQTYPLVGGTVNIMAVKDSKPAAATKKTKAPSVEPKASKAGLKKTDTPAEQRAVNTAKSKKSGGDDDIPDNIKTLLAGSGNQLSGLQICVTGIPPTIGRKNAELLVVAYGAKLMKSLSKKTDYVVVGDDAGPKKLEQIEGLGIKSLDEGELIEMIESGGSGKRDADDDTDMGEGSEEDEKSAKAKRQKK
ncbi:hypothetical protein B7463_g10441, partial [Scytalidium lignicola]